MPELVRFTSAVRLTAAAPDATDPEGSPSSRTIEGLAIAYGVPAVAGDGITYRFRPGSLQARRGVTPALLGHDLQRPAGILRELRQADGGPTAVIAVDRTPDGDLALAQAASGSRAGLSIGAEPITFSIGEGDVVDVELAELAELSLVTIPAWEAATVSRVTAQSGGAMPPPVAAVHDPEPTPPPAPDPVPPLPSPEPQPELVLAHRAPLVVAGGAPPRLTLDGFVSALVRAERGDQEARRLIQAAAPVPSYLADNPGVLPIQYTTELLGELPASRPLVSICAQRAMPSSGMLIRKPVWTTKPNGGWVADDTVGAPTNTPKIGLHDVAVEQWQYAFATSQAVAERSSPDYIEAVYRQAIVDYHNDCEAKLAAAIVAEAAGADTTIGAGIAAVYTATGRVANVLLLAPDAYGALVDADGTHRFSQGSVGLSGGNLVGNIYGLDVVVSGSLPPTTAIVGVRNAIEFRETNPIRLSANVIGAMTIELGVLSFATFDIEVPDAFVPVGVPVPPVLQSASRSSK